MIRKSKFFLLVFLIVSSSILVSASFLTGRIATLEGELENYQKAVYEARITLKRLNYDYLDEIIGKLNNNLQKAKDIIAIDDDADEAYIAVADITNFLKEANVYLHESLPIETRGMWMDNFTIDSFYTREDVARHMDELQSINVNMIFPDVYGNGAAIYPSKVVPQHDRFKTLFQDEDVLAVIIDEAHKRNIEVHPLVRVFALHNGVRHFIEDKVDWLDLTSENRFTLDNGYYWLSPSHPEVREYLMEFLTELTENYDIDGVHLDYIRFDANFGYNEHTRNLFKAFNGIDPFDISSTGLEEEFKLFKWQFVNSFIERVFYELKSIKPNLLVSAAVASPYSWGKKDLGQDWLSWAYNRQINFMTPMSYRSTPESYASTVRSEITTIMGSTYIFTGLGVYLYDEHVMIEQLDAGRLTNMSGQAIFSTANMKHNDYVFLRKGPWSKPAIPTFRDPQQAAALLAKDLLVRLNEFKPLFDNTEAIDSYILEIERLSKQIDALDLRPWDTRDLREAKPEEATQLEPIIEDIKSLTTRINREANRDKLIPLKTAERLISDLGWIDSLLKPLLYTSHPYEYYMSR
ncbi:MAG: family 10 glycosylhydrolase [Firmicutes bacterium]|nr:family 10 glycosylhydrolase [Bacillota bacterium]MDD4692779.1 family 10 glycosylhydrolase [Bacillota bacterium]